MPSRRPRRTAHLAALLTLAVVVGATPVAGGAGPQAQAAASPNAVSADHSAELGYRGQLRDPSQERQGYPRQTTLAVPPVDGSDAALRLGLTPYHELAPRLNELQARSTRVSAEVIGRTVTGRELYLVTLTSPESAVQASRQERIRGLIVDQPAQAARVPGLAERYKVSVFVNANLHGNEWEGTDAALRLIEDYATSDDPTVRHTLDSSRIYLVVSANPDGRHDNTRRNASGFDLNRDFVTASQPEVLAVRDALIRTQPMVMLDLHGYVNGTLVEPATPPHGENYEYDLFLKHAYPNGLGIEQAVLELGYNQQEDGVTPPQIPFRDSEGGWDDWPPIFTPQYAALHGATAAHTIEVPLRVNRTDYDQPVEELQRRSAINTDIGHAAMTASIGYAVEHRNELLADQIEIFRRGQAGEPQRPVTSEGVPEAAPHDVYLTDYPRAYLIPTGQGQRSETAAARLVDHLIANDVEVTRARRPVAVDDTTYPAGSYVVDMHQSKRGMANTILAAGTDVSERVDAVYDISGWSHGLLWGADVTTVPEGTDLDVVGRLVEAAAPTGSVEGAGDLVLELEDPDDVAALNSLLTSEVAVQWLDDGTVLVPARARDQAERVARDFGVQLRAADAGEEGTDLAGLEIAAAATPEELWALEEMGFSVTEVNPAILNDEFDWSAVDSLYVSSGLSWGSLDGDARADLTAYLSRGGGLVGRGGQGAALNDAADLLELDAVTGRGDANGVVVVVNSADSPIAGGATPHTFVYSPMWFTDLGEEVTVEQRYAAQAPLVSGHWRPETAGAGGRDDAAGEAVVVSGLSESGAAVVLFGSEPLFRAHPKGQYSLVAKALIWSADEGT